METNTSLRCACGSLSGTVHRLSPDAGLRVVCYCDDCQAFTHYLERSAQELDSLGGTEIFQTSPARVEIQSGELACMRLSDRGVLRWYAKCCRAPIGNTLNSRSLPFVGLIASRLDTDEATLGPIRARVMARFAKGSVAGESVYPGLPYGLGLRLVGRILMSRLRGEHLASPFFDRSSGKPVSQPVVLSAAERQDLARACDAA